MERKTAQAATQVGLKGIEGQEDPEPRRKGMTKISSEMSRPRYIPVTARDVVERSVTRRGNHRA
jgi:hypothetical protein